MLKHLLTYIFLRSAVAATRFNYEWKVICMQTPYSFDKSSFNVK
jgi:hypothetical protein